MMLSLFVLCTVVYAKLFTLPYWEQYPPLPLNITVGKNYYKHFILLITYNRSKGIIVLQNKFGLKQKVGLFQKTKEICEMIIGIASRTNISKDIIENYITMQSIDYILIAFINFKHR